MKPRRKLSIAVEELALTKPFVISRGAESSVVVVVVRLEEGGARGWGESTPYARFGETAQGVASAIESCRAEIEGQANVTAAGLDLSGAAANAVDCALVDLACKRNRIRAWRLLGQAEPLSLATVATVTLDDPAKMAADARRWPGFGMLKMKLGSASGDLERVQAVRDARPDARLICDANEGWSLDQLDNYAGALFRCGVELIEQPCPAGSDEGLRDMTLPIPLCADESCHRTADVESLVGKYGLVNIKLDKAGGITGALALAAAAKKHGMGVMVGCMLGSSLAMAPGVLAGQHATFVDLDGPLTLRRDRKPSMTYRDGLIEPPTPELWG